MRSFKTEHGFALLLLAASTQSLGASQQGAAPSGSLITGRISDVFECPMVGAIVQLRPSTAPFVDAFLQKQEADSEGAFTFNNVPEGTYWIHYQLMPAGGWGGDRVTVTPTGAQVTFHTGHAFPLDFVDFDFFVRDLLGDPVRGAQVSWRRYVGAPEKSSCAPGSAVTADDGHARYPSPPPGHYQVTVEADGYAPRSLDLQHGWGSRTHIVKRLTIEQWKDAENASRGVRVWKPGPSLEEYIEHATGPGAIDCGTFSTAHNGMALPPRLSSKATTRLESMYESIACAQQALNEGKGFKIVQRGYGMDSELASGILGNGDGSIIWFWSDSAPCGGPRCWRTFDTKPCALEDVTVVKQPRGNHIFGLATRRGG